MLRSVLTVTTPATSSALTTLDRVKAELNIQDGSFDTILTTKIGEASSDIQAALGGVLASEVVTETFWHEDVIRWNCFQHSRQEGDDTLFLERTPVTAVASVTVDDVAVSTAEYRLDPKAGLLYRLDSAGYPCAWRFVKSIVVAYTGGFILPGQAGRTLEPAIEGAAVALISSYWFSRSRDPTIKSEDVSGIRRVDYWVGAVGDPEQLPPRVLASLAPFQRPVVA